MPDATWKAKLGSWITKPAVEHTLMVLIILNAIILGLETYPSVMASYGGWLLTIDGIILSIFVVEIVLRIAAHGWRFFKDPWGLFDFAVVTIALVPATGPFAVLRSLRVLRVLRLLTLVPSMRAVIGGLLGALPGLSSVIAGDRTVSIRLDIFCHIHLDSHVHHAEFIYWCCGDGNTRRTRSGES